MSFSNERVTLEDKAVVEILYPLHEIDSFNGDELKNYIRCIEGEIDGIIINFSRITYLNSSGLRELIQILKFLKEREKKLIFTSISEDIKKIFVHTNLDRLFKITADDKEAESLFHEQD